MKRICLLIGFIVLCVVIHAQNKVFASKDLISNKNTKPGDTIFVQGEICTNPIVIRNLKGTKEKPIVITPLNPDKFVLNGTDILPSKWDEVTPDSESGKLIQEAQWKRIKGKVFALQVKDPIYALVFEGKLMSDARWPNARWDDPWRIDRYMVLRRASETSVKGELNDGLSTENTLEESEKWLHYNRSKLKHRDEMLGDLDISFEGAVVVMSYSWGSWATRVTNHEKGSDRFNYDTEFIGSGKIQKEALTFLNKRIGWNLAHKKFQKCGHGGLQFFLMGLPALDIEEEWWYDEASKTVFFISPDGKNPNDFKIEGKRRDYMLEAMNCDYVELKDFNFYGSAALMKGSTNSKIEDCNFIYAAMHKFGVGNFDMPVTTTILNPQGKNYIDKIYGNALINCQFTYQDGNAFEGRSYGLVVDNVLIYRTQQTTLGLDSRSMSLNRPLLIRRVTIDDVGASVGIKGGGRESVYELNNIMHFGGLQYDGASLQMGGRDKVIYRFNWSHDHPKRSYRFDSGNYPTYANAFGEMSYNVAWNTPGGFALKGDDHLLHNNLIVDGGFELFNMRRWASKNERTLVANNIVSYMSAGTNDWDKPVKRKSNVTGKIEVVEDYWLKETKPTAEHPKFIGTKANEFDDGTKKYAQASPILAVRKNNYTKKQNEVLRDPANLDFRLREGVDLIDGGHTITNKDVPWKELAFTGSDLWEGKPDIGPYEKNDKYYWIPGFKFGHASTPIPPHESLTAKTDCDLMWLGAYKSTKHLVYFGNDKKKVEDANKSSIEFKGEYEGKRNIYTPDIKLISGNTYYWRIDALKEGKIVKGKVWKFTVE